MTVIEEGVLGLFHHRSIVASLGEDRLTRMFFVERKPVEQT